MLGENQICLTWRATQISTRPHSFWAFSFFSSSRGSPGRLQVAGNSLWGYIPPMIEFPRPKKNKPTRANPPGEIQHDCRQDCPALPGIIRIAGFSRDHWLPDWCCGFSTTIPGTAPKRHTSPPHGDASSRLITTNVETTAQEMVCCIGRECVWVKVLMSFIYLAASHDSKSQPQRGSCSSSSRMVCLKILIDNSLYTQMVRITILDNNNNK